MKAFIPSVVLGLALAVGAAGCRPTGSAGGAIDGVSLHKGLFYGQVQELFSAHQLVPVDGGRSPDGQPVPGAYYVADVCPDCGGFQCVHGTVYFNKDRRLLSWHAGDIAEARPGNG